MEVLKGFLSMFKEILYHVFGYLVPGLFILSLFTLPAITGGKASPMFLIYRIIYNSNVIN